MKKLLLLLPIASLFWAGCENDFEVTAPWKEVPVVYAILSPDDTAHYVRVEKAFLDPETNANEIAQIPDSLYYPENAIAVYLERDSDKKRYQMTRVDGTQEGFSRKSGVFATAPNWLYKVKPAPGQPIVEVGKKYNVVVKRNDGRPDVTGSTTIPTDYIFFSPNQMQTPPIFNFAWDKPSSIEWRTDINALYFNIYFTIRYREEAPDGTVLGKKTLLWKARTKAARNSQPLSGSNNFIGKADILGDEFFKFLVDNIPAANGTFRYFEAMDVTLEGGGVELRKFEEVSSASGGITGAEVIPSYTNMSEGFGLVISKNATTLTNVRTLEPTVKQMNERDLTRLLNFRT